MGWIDAIAIVESAVSLSLQRTILRDANSIAAEVYIREPAVPILEAITNNLGFSFRCTRRSNGWK